MLFSSSFFFFFIHIFLYLVSFVSSHSHRHARASGARVCRQTRFTALHRWDSFTTPYSSYATVAAVSFRTPLSRISLTMYLRYVFYPQIHVNICPCLAVEQHDLDQTNKALTVRVANRLLRVYPVYWRDREFSSSPHVSYDIINVKSSVKSETFKRHFFAITGQAANI